jgi:methylenetetrahydrofolate reductase (NADPH)
MDRKIMQVSLELIPRDETSLESSSQLLPRFPQIDCVNIPDLLRFPIRSWEACPMLKKAGNTQISVIPHLRAMDFSLDKPFPHTEYFIKHNIDRVLVIAGDPPKDENTKTYDTSSSALIKKLKNELPNIQVFAAFDPYRTNIRYEIDYVKEKEDAGADGFMSQPFFDLRLLEIYAEYLEGKNVFWGISPVLSESSRNYWESRNRAIVPKSFKPDLFWNVDFGRRVYQFCKQHNFNLYLMPIKVDLEAYLSGLFS